MVLKVQKKNYNNAQHNYHWTFPRIVVLKATIQSYYDNA